MEDVLGWTQDGNKQEELPSCCPVISGANLDLQGNTPAMLSVCNSLQKEASPSLLARVTVYPMMILLT